jgi:AcrR family transcriptional regulator
VPRIEAATVAEHRSRQRAALLHATEQLLMAQGYGGLRFADVARRAGLARSSVYEYFTSKDDLVAAVCEEVLPRWLDRLSQQMAQARTPADKLAAYVRTQLTLVADGSHRLALVVAGAPLSPQARERIAEVHTRFAPNITDVLADLGHPHPDLAASYVQAIVNEATRQLHAGAPPSQVIDTAVSFTQAAAAAGPTDPATTHARPGQPGKRRR